MEYISYNKTFTYNEDNTIHSIADVETGATDTYSYTDGVLSKITNTTTASTNYRESIYDAAGKILTIIMYKADGTKLAEAINTYNDQGNITSEKMMNGVTWTYSYDLTGKLLSKASTLGDNTTYTYTDTGREVEVVFCGSTTRRIETLYVNRAGASVYVSVKEIFSNGVTHTIENNEFGELIHFANSAGFEYSKEYNTVGNLSKYQDSHQTTMYEYDVTGVNLLKQLQNGTVVIENTYADGHITLSSNVSSDETIAYSYNAAGLVSLIVKTVVKIEDPFMM